MGSDGMEWDTMGSARLRGASGAIEPGSAERITGTTSNARGMTERTRANYALCEFGEHLGEHRNGLDVPWAEFVGNRSSERTFGVPTARTIDPYIGLQAFDVDEWAHEILINGDPLSGFDVPPADGWQYWADRITGGTLREGENTVRIVRDTDTDDGFVIGTLAVHWKEPLD